MWEPEVNTGCFPDCSQLTKVRSVGLELNSELAHSANPASQLGPWDPMPHPPEHWGCR